MVGINIDKNVIVVLLTLWEIGCDSVRCCDRIVLRDYPNYAVINDRAIRSLSALSFRCQESDLDS